MTTLPSILFVCMGNICRSPTAEIVWTQKLQNVLKNNDLLPKLDSAGTIAYHQGDPPDPRMQVALRNAGYRPFGVSRKITPSDFEEFDLILAMDAANLREVSSLANATGNDAKHCHLFLRYANIEGVTEVPDPYYGGKDGFQKVVQLIESGCDHLLDRLIKDAQI